MPRILYADGALHVATGRFCDGRLRYFASMWFPGLLVPCFQQRWLDGNGRTKAVRHWKNSDPTQADGSELRGTDAAYCVLCECAFINDNPTITFPTLGWVCPMHGVQLVKYKMSRLLRKYQVPHSWILFTVRKIHKTTLY